MRVLVYARVSTDEQDTLEEQISSGRTFAIKQSSSATISEEKDKLSGFDNQRPGYLRLLKAARDSEIDAVVVWKLDRLGRDHAEAIRAAQELDRLGIKLWSVTEPVEHPFFRDMMFLWAGEASRQTSQRVRLKMVSQAKEGLWPGRVPVGYLLGPNRHLIPDPRKASLITKLFELAATGEYSLAGLRDQAENMGLRFGSSAYGCAICAAHKGDAQKPKHVHPEQPISRTRVGTILKNLAYVGDVVYGRTPHGRFEERHHVPEGEWTICPDAHPSLVTRETFAAVGAILNRNRSPAFQASVRGTNYLLTGLLKCGDCGSRMYSGKGGTGRGKYMFYQYCCVRGSEYGHCTVKSIGGVGIDDYVKNALKAFRVDSVDHAIALEKLTAENQDRQQDTDAQRLNFIRRLKYHDQRRVDLGRQRFDSDIPADVYAKLEAEEKQAIEIINKALTGLTESRPLDISAELEFLESMPDHADFDLEAWQDFARLFIESVTVHRRDGQRSTRWHFNLDVDIAWTPAAAILRGAVSAGL